MREYSNKSFPKNHRFLNPDLINSSSCISDFIDLHFYSVVAITITSLFLLPKVLNNVLSKPSLGTEQIYYGTRQNDLNHPNIYTGLDISEVDIKSESSVLRYFSLNFLEFIFECGDNSLVNSSCFITYSESFFKFAKLFFSDQNTVNSFCADIPAFSKSEYIKFFEDLKMCNSLSDFSRICYKEELTNQIVRFIKKTYNITN